MISASRAERGVVQEGRRMWIEVVQSCKNLEEDCVERSGGWSPSTAGAFASTGECHCGRDASPTWMTDESAGSTEQARADSPVAGRHRQARKCRGKSAWTLRGAIWKSGVESPGVWLGWKWIPVHSRNTGGRRTWIPSEVAKPEWGTQPPVLRVTNLWTSVSESTRPARLAERVGAAIQ